ncbi:hypothetical protein [Epilithonimonas sp.]|uniref:hypothetical protein n=1 Tax=Epilithonimonas sp. TaxID=2894511 RepID=UPI0028A28653|nr:hypothetical protein [Epilithonimonas sp.]
MPNSLEIKNSTNYIISGEVSYMTIFCSSHYFFVKPNSIWKSNKRGICPIVTVSAIVKTPRGTFSAKPYLTSGTTQGNFEVVELKENVFKVIKMKSEINEKNSILDIHENKHIEKP